MAKTAGMSFTIAPGRAIVTPTSPSAGPYVVTVDALETRSFTPGDATRDRIDIVAIKVDETAGVESPASIVILAGTPGSPTAVAPKVPGAHLALYQVRIPAGASAGNGGWSTANMVDLRKRAVSNGAAIPVSSTAERDSLEAFDGMQVMRLDLGGSIDRYVAGRWRGNTAMMFMEPASGWRTMVDSNHILYPHVRLRCRVVGDGTMLWLGGEIMYTGSGNVYEGQVVGQIPPDQKISIQDGSWIMGTDDDYRGSIIMRVSRNGQITIGPAPNGKIFMFQGTVPLDFTN